MGDITDGGVLDLAQAMLADALILTVRDIETAEKACGQQVRLISPSIFIAACVETVEAAPRIVAAADHLTIGQIVMAASLRDALIAGVGIRGA